MAKSSAVLVTRPAPDNARTADALRARGYDVLLAPVLRCELRANPIDHIGDATALIVTSANALRAVENDPLLPALTRLPLFAVGEHTGSVARAMNFKDVRIAGGNAVTLVALTAQARPPRLLYLAGEETTADLAAEFAGHGIAVRTRIAYRMAPEHRLPAEAIEAFEAGGIEAVLHYSRRSAQIFTELAAGVRNALLVPQCCLSPAIAEIVVAAGATKVAAAPQPRESDLLETLDRMLTSAHK